MKQSTLRRLLTLVLAVLLVMPLSMFAQAAFVPQLKPTNEVRWIDRIADLPDYAMDFYDWLEENSDGDGVEDALIDPLTAEQSGGSYFYTAAVFDEKLPFTVEDGQNVGQVGSDVASAQINATQDEARAYITAAYSAFIRDHAEVFWLNGMSSIGGGSISISFNNDGSGWVASYTQTVQFILKSTYFDVREDAYTEPAAIYGDIETRDAAVVSILGGTFPSAGSRYAQVRYLNKWLTENNCYNSDVASCGHYAHVCLSALVGSTGKNGPVCEGYAEAFKVLCDAVGIPCVLVDGDSKTSLDDTPGAHMWNCVQMEDGNWYGVDVTWNDPVYGYDDDAISGVENEDYLLVGTDTQIDGMLFSESHLPKNQVTMGGIAFMNGPVLSRQRYQAPETVVKAIRMEMGNSLNMQFAVPKAQRDDWAGVYAKIVHGERTETVPVSRWGTDDQDPGVYVVTYDGVAAKAMTDKIEIAIYDGNGQQIGGVYSDSVRDYAMRILTRDREQAAWTMIVDMLYYGAEAQATFDYKQYDLATAKLSSAQQALASKAGTYTDVTNGQGKARLELKSKIDLQILVPEEHKNKVITYSFTNHNNRKIVETAPVQYDAKNRISYIVIDKIVVADARQVITVQADGETIATDSVESYAKRLSKSADGSPLYEAIMRFADSARAYLHRNDNQ